MGFLSDVKRGVNGRARYDSYALDEVWEILRATESHALYACMGEITGEPENFHKTAHP